jgi:hypothetical protein
MQEKMQKISPIKQRILQFIETLNVSKRYIYGKIGVSRGTLEANSGITEDVLAKFIASFPDISLDWLLLGTGDMLRENSENLPSNDGFRDKYFELLEENRGLNKEIRELANRINKLKDEMYGMKNG